MYKNIKSIFYMELSPKQIFDELNKYVVGQDEAKKTIAIAFRNRYRRMNILNQGLQEDIIPKNVLLIGSTGVGKTEIVRKASQICKSPFVKVEATRFTEVGYVGKDVESIIRDLMDQTVIKYKNDAKKVHEKIVHSKAKLEVLSKIYEKENATNQDDKEVINKKFENGDFDKMKISIDIKDDQSDIIQNVDIPGMPQNIQMGMVSLSEVFKIRDDDKYKKINTSVTDAIKLLSEEYADSMINEKKIVDLAIKNICESGVIFIDEIDKLISSQGAASRGEVSREGVQRDLLSIIEGTNVSTKYGYIDTRHILFIGCGAFYSVKPSDLLPELQGRFPIRAKLKNLTYKDFVDILSHTQNNLLKQYYELMKVDGVEINFDESGINEIARISNELNTENENLGARRLHTVIEKVLESISFEYPTKEKKKVVKKVTIDEQYVTEKLSDLMKLKTEYSKYIL